MDLGTGSGLMSILARGFVAVATLACGVAWTAPGWADQAADVAAIEALDAQWVAAVATKDPAATAAFYAEDGMIMPPGAPASVGREAIAATWAALFGLKEFSLTFAPTTIDVAVSGDIAYDIGTYMLEFETEAGDVQDKGKYVVAWKKVGDEWQVAADIFNSDLPPAPPASSSD
jgi:uncharacterized protein (TIGR02246 family)